MAKKKSVATVTASAALPAGFAPVTAGSFPATHDFKRESTLRGIVQEKKTVPQRRGSKTEEVPLLVVANSETGELTSVWHSAALSGIMEQADKGDEVFIRFDGVKKLKGKKTLKQFTCGIMPRKGKK
jgi:hypothetical protein